MGVSEVSMRWIKLLFIGSSAAVNLNGSAGECFNIERGVRQGYPIAPYLFLIVGEALTNTVKKLSRKKDSEDLSSRVGPNNIALVNIPTTLHLW